MSYSAAVSILLGSFCLTGLGCAHKGDNDDRENGNDANSSVKNPVAGSFDGSRKIFGYSTFRYSSHVTDDMKRVGIENAITIRLGSRPQDASCDIDPWRDGETRDSITIELPVASGRFSIAAAAESGHCRASFQTVKQVGGSEGLSIDDWPAAGDVTIEKVDDSQITGQIALDGERETKLQGEFVARHCDKNYTKMIRLEVPCTQQ